ncbi:MAG: PQQ-binding-like beta-propeller repeat protein [Kiritimatiellae bacterium]|nr:PQQ-binding-like beta-propeller repeat protein [Kiritimatiellia bacterium]
MNNSYMPVMAFVAIGLFGLLRAEDWTQWRGSNRDLIVTEQNLLKEWPAGGPQRLWKIDLPGEGYSVPIVVGDTIYITGSVGGKNDRAGHLYALDTKDGSLRWELEYAPEWASSYNFARTSPTFRDGKLFLIGGLGHVVCVEAKDGKIIWKLDAHEHFGGRNITWGIADNPLVYDNKVICQPGGNDAAVVALDVNTGKTVWKSVGLSERSAYCSPALLTIGGRRQVVTMLEDHAVGLDAETGQPLWKHAHRNKHAVHPNTPVLCGTDLLFMSSGYNYGSEIIFISDKDVKQLWSDKTSDNHFQGVAFHEGRIFSSGGGKLFCIDPKNGNTVYTVDGARKTSFCITSSGMITYDAVGGSVMLVQVGENNYKVVSSFKVDYGNGEHWSSPVVANGVMYLRRGKGLAAHKISAH